MVWLIGCSVFSVYDSPPKDGTKNVCQMGEFSYSKSNQIYLQSEITELAQKASQPLPLWLSLSLDPWTGSGKT